MTLLTRLRRVAVAAFIFTGVLAVPSVALAQDDGTEVVAPGIVDGGEYIVSPQLWKLITAILIPVVVALLTKVNARPLVKGAIAIVISFIDALVLRAVTLPDGAAMFSQAMIEDVVYIYAIQFLSYFGFYKLPQVNLAGRSFVAPNAGLS